MNKKEIEIEINGKNYIFPLGIGMVGECLDNLNLTVEELGDKIDKNAFKYVPSIMFESLKYQYDDEITFSKKEFISFLDKDIEGLKKIGSFRLAFIKSFTPNLPEEPKTNPQKKQPKKK